MIAGKDAPTFGEAKNSWLTGTAAWNYYAITQWILGIRTDSTAGDRFRKAGKVFKPFASSGASLTTST
jgi:hypothetical protein